MQPSRSSSRPSAQEALRAEFPVDGRSTSGRARTRRSRSSSPARSTRRSASSAATWARTRSALGQPLIGAGGRLVRAGDHLAPASRNRRRGRAGNRLEAALQHALLTNTVPYKPPGNKAYPEAVKERFRPFLAELLGRFWTGRPRHHAGDRGIPAGSTRTAIRRSSRRSGPATTGSSRELRLPAPVTWRRPAGRPSRTSLVLPLPHPSPLNRRWHGPVPGPARPPPRTLATFPKEQSRHRG